MNMRPNSPPNDAEIEEVDDAAAAIDAAALDSNLTKDTLRRIALDRLAELRNQLQTVKQSLRHSERVSEAATQLHNTHASHFADEIERLRDTNRHLETQLQLAQSNLQQFRQQRNNVSAVNDDLASPAVSPVHRAAAEHDKPHLKLSPPDKFDGNSKTQLVTSWLYSVERYLRLMKVDTEDKIDVAVTLLTGTALEWWQAAERNAGGSLRDIDWSDFEQRCVKRFQPIAASEAAMQRLMTWRQTGNVSAFISGFQSIAQQIPIDLLPEQARVLMFLKGLSPTLQTHVRMMQPETLDDAMNHAQRASQSIQPAVFIGSSSGFNRDRQSGVSRTSSNFNQFHNPTSGSRFAPIMIENIENQHEQDVHQSPTVMRVTSPAGSDTTSLQYLSAEQKKLYQENRCFKCRKVGHQSRECHNTNQPKN